MKKLLCSLLPVLSISLLSGCAVSGPRVWVEPPRMYVPAVVVEPAPAVIVVEERHYHGHPKKHKRHYHRCHRCDD